MVKVLGFLRLGTGEFARARPEERSGRRRGHRVAEDRGRDVGILLPNWSKCNLEAQ